MAKVIIVRPEITEEENQIRINKLNEVLSEIAHSQYYIELPIEEKLA